VIWRIGGRHDRLHEFPARAGAMRGSSPIALGLALVRDHRAQQLCRNAIRQRARPLLVMMGTMTGVAGWRAARCAQRQRADDSEEGYLRHGGRIAGIVLYLAAQRLGIERRWAMGHGPCPPLLRCACSSVVWDLAVADVQALIALTP